MKFGSSCEVLQKHGLVRFDVTFAKLVCREVLRIDVSSSEVFDLSNECNS